MKFKRHEPGNWQRRARLGEWYCYESDSDSSWYPAKSCDIRFARDGTTYSVAAWWELDPQWSCCGHSKPTCSGCAHRLQFRRYKMTVDSQAPGDRGHITLVNEPCATFEEAEQKMEETIDQIENVSVIAKDIMEALL